MELAVGQTVHFYIFEKDYTAEVVALHGFWRPWVHVRRRDGVVLTFDWSRSGRWVFMGGPATLFDGVGPTERRKEERKARKLARRAEKVRRGDRQAA